MATENLALLREGGRSDSTAFCMAGRERTYEEFAQDVARLAGRLRASGVRRGDRVLAFAENSPAFMSAFLASARIGAIFATAYPSFLDDELDYILENSSPRVALVGSAQRGRFSAAADRHGLEHVYELADWGVDGMPSGDPVGDDLPVTDDDGVLISYTSGTTSRPKPVLHSHGGLLAATRIHSHLWHISAADCVLVAVPMAWLFGSVTASLTALAGGARISVLPHFNPVAALDAIERDRVTFFPGVGTMFAKLIEAATGRERSAEATSLRLCLAGGEARNDAVLERFRALFGCPVHDIYGASECFPIATYDPERDPEPIPGAAGRLAPGVDAKLVDAEDQEVPDGDSGELLVRSAASMIGYYNERELTEAAVDEDGAYRTRDICRIDDAGYLYVLGRASDMIIRGGANVSPAEVERVLCKHPAVVEAAVVGAPDPVYGERVVAFVQLVAGAAASAEELNDHCSEQLASYKVPRDIRFIENLARTATGKIAKKQLIAEANLNA